MVSGFYIYVNTYLCKYKNTDVCKHGFLCLIMLEYSNGVILSSKVFCPWHPLRLERKNSLLVEDFLVLVREKKVICLRKMIVMLDDLNTQGLDSRYVKHLFDAIYELKDRTSDGGARVYFIAGDEQEFYAFHAECKKERDSSDVMLSDGIEIMEASEAGRAIFPKSNTPKRWRTVAKGEK
jgi:phage-related protein